MSWTVCCEEKPGAIWKPIRSGPMKEKYGSSFASSFNYFNLLIFLLTVKQK